MTSVPKFIGQPSSSQGDVAAKLAAAMRRKGRDSTWMVTTVSDRATLHRLAPGTRELRRRGGNIEAIITIVAGGANAKGLLEAMKIIDTPYAIVATSARTTGAYFYVTQGPESATVVLGPPGFSDKAGKDVHESAVVLELDLTDKKDAAFLAELRAHFDGLLAEPDLCRPLTEDLIPDLVATADEPVQRKPTRRATGESTGISGFYKRLSRNDVSLTDSPGQIIIPRGFLSFFDELNMKRDRSAGGGPRQRHREFTLTFLDGDFEAEVDTARVVLYVPAANHSRRNPEMRFTFRDRDILERLSEGDVLVFRREKGKVVVERCDPDWAPPNAEPGTRFGVL